MELARYLPPAFGVYAVGARTADGQEYDGVANLGRRPMFEPTELLETNLFGFGGDLYGQMLEVDLVRFLRGEAKFENIGELVAQMERDAEEARTLLNSSLA